jgi:hypothetical protein
MAKLGPCQTTWTLQTVTVTQRSHPLDNTESNRPASLASANATAAEPPSPRSSQPAQVDVDDSKALAGYANFCRVTATPEELIIDFGLNPQPLGVPTRPIAVTQRIVTNLYTAKRLVHALQLTVQRHEATFGAIETNIQQRARRT